MLSWSAHKMLKDIEVVFKKKSDLMKATLNPRPEEKEFHDSIIQGPDELLMGRVLSFVDNDVKLEFEREEREEPPTKPDVADGHRHEQDQKEIPTPINTYHEKLLADVDTWKSNQQRIEEKLDVFTPINFFGTHWVLLEISLTSYLIKAYDSDITMVSNKEFENKMSRWRKMLPYLIQSSGLLSHRNDVQLQAEKVRFKFTRPGTE
ncbi:uncharacterized protein LOC133814246 [Humulus lupulus]|uniref:uncharacterized protein LOC133814246 n=1 Tax=Humulus lupulus TaxID=3486 RepID=UPI002B40BE0E|nr:uncharacterized protein LOC133814246 [Humulus lupulus]